MLSNADSVWKQHKEVYVLVGKGCHIINVTLVYSIVLCKECGETSDQRTQDLHLRLYAGVSKHFLSLCHYLNTAYLSPITL